MVDKLITLAKNGAFQRLVWLLPSSRKTMW